MDAWHLSVARGIARGKRLRGLEVVESSSRRAAARMLRVFLDKPGAARAIVGRSDERTCANFSRDVWHHPRCWMRAGQLHAEVSSPRVDRKLTKAD